MVLAAQVPIKRPRYHALPTSHGWLAWRLEEMDEEGEETQSANAVQNWGVMNVDLR